MINNPVFLKLILILLKKLIYCFNFLVIFMDIVGRMDADHHTLTTQVAAEVGSIKERATQRAWRG